MNWVYGIIIFIVMISIFGPDRERERECIEAYDKGEYMSGCSKYYLDD